MLKLPFQCEGSTLTVANAIDVDSNGTHVLSTFCNSEKACVQRLLLCIFLFSEVEQYRLPDSILDM
jgi:hypothetical protein